MGDNTMTFHLGETSRKRLVGIDNRWFLIIDLALTITHIDFSIVRDGGLRTTERQQALFADPKVKTKCDGVTLRSKHQDGLALDFCAYVDGKASWNHLHLTHIAAALLQAASILGYKVKWGGFFGSTGWDKPHLELID